MDQPGNEHKIYPHYTCAVNTENIKVVFSAVQETLLREILNDIF